MTDPPPFPTNLKSYMKPCLGDFVHWSNKSLTGHGADESLKLLLVLAQFNEQEPPQSDIECCPTPQVQVAVGDTQEGKVLWLQLGKDVYSSHNFHETVRV